MPIAVLAVMTVVLVAGRITLNVVDSNVIDVGYSGVIGADRIADGKPIYDNFPDDDQSGDTYGPVAYYAYVPFEQVLPWSGTWDDLPAAHAAAIFFDLGDDGRPVPDRQATAPGPAGDRARHHPLLRLGRLPVHGLRAGVEHQRRPGLARRLRRRSYA